MNLFTLEASLESTCTLHIADVTRLDCATVDVDSGVTGQSWHVDVDVTGHKNSKGFLIDFSGLKKTLKQICDSTHDHTLIVPQRSPCVTISRDNERYQIKVSPNSQQQWIYDSPVTAVSILDADSVNCELIEIELSRMLLKALPQNITQVKVSLREEVCNGAVFFQYTHGLYNYDGDCRRIFHGHRGMVRVYQNNIYNEQLSQRLRDEFLGKHIHIACIPQIKERQDRHAILQAKENGPKITAQVPIDNVLFLDDETSIENIAESCLEWLRRSVEESGTPLKVEIFEGIYKSASVTAEI